MTQRPLEPTKAKSVLKSVTEGMEVYDNQNKKIGKVEELYFGASSDERMKHGAGAATAPNPNLRDNTFIDDVARAIFDDEEVPQEMRQRLFNDGFIRIDVSGILAGDRYALPEQIDHVADQQVYLNVRLDDLLKR